MHGDKNCLFGTQRNINALAMCVRIRERMRERMASGHVVCFSFLSPLREREREREREKGDEGEGGGLVVV